MCRQVECRLDNSDNDRLRRTFQNHYVENVERSKVIRCNLGHIYRLKSSKFEPVSMNHFLSPIELIVATKKSNSVKSDEGSNFVDILANAYQCQVHVVEHECFKKRGVYE